MRIAMLSAILLFPGLLADEEPQTTKRFIGHWRLISYDQTSTSGEVTQPLGKNPIGRISYDTEGYMSAQLMRRDRSRFANTDYRNGGTDAEIRDAFTGYSGYYGSYTVDEKAGTVTHHVEGAWFPNPTLTTGRGFLLFLRVLRLEALCFQWQYSQNCL